MTTAPWGTPWDSRLALAAPSAPEVVDAAVDVVAPVAGAVLVAAAVPVAPVCLLGALIPVFGVPGAVVVGVLGVPAVLVGVAAVVLVLGEAGLGQQTTAGAALRRAVRRLGPLVVLTIRSLPALVVGVLVFGLGRLAFATVVLLLEEATPAEASRRSGVLLRGVNGTAALVLGLGLGLAASVALGVYGLSLLLVPAPRSGSAAVDALHLVIGGLAGAVLATVTLGASAFRLFISRREQLEALDLQLALRKIAGLT